ncbi:hypothetical protein HAX54_016728 [Datura stramonium]|uniref:BHLH domain-containing protein n=1 Tax=Datura stramonium TaxID=4076 RepID=A0ABS8UKX7_DATST|nr:hypothetical protein [Datura stramonium]
MYVQDNFSFVTSNTGREKRTRKRGIVYGEVSKKLTPRRKASRTAAICLVRDITENLAERRSAEAEGADFEASVAQWSELQRFLHFASGDFQEIWELVKGTIQLPLLEYHLLQEMEYYGFNQQVISTNGKLTQAQDHIIAERKRREKLSQRFIALSALIPGLKKMDKASVLGDAIKYLKQLQERVKTLEEQTKKKSVVESVVFVKKYELYGDNGENSSSDENYSSGTQLPVDEPLPEIEARISGRDVLIRIHCEKRKGIVDKTVAEIEKLHLSVINTCALFFGTSALDITIIACMDEEFAMTVKDLVKNLRSSLKMFM